MFRTILVAFLLVSISLCFAQRKIERPNYPPSRRVEMTSETFKEAIVYFSKDSRNISAESDDQIEVDGMYEIIVELGKAAAKLNDEGCTQAFLDFPTYHPDLIAAKASAFRNFSEPVQEAIPFLLNCMDSLSTGPQTKAAEVLILWDVEWDSALLQRK